MITKFKLYEKLVKLEDIIDGFIRNACRKRKI